jgi:hypothetical protein
MSSSVVMRVSPDGEVVGSCPFAAIYLARLAVWWGTISGPRGARLPGWWGQMAGRHRASGQVGGAWSA